MGRVPSVDVATHPRRQTTLQDPSPGHDTKSVRVGLHGATQEAHSQEGKGVPLQRKKVSFCVARQPTDLGLRRSVERLALTWEVLERVWLCFAQRLGNRMLCFPEVR